MIFILYTNLILNNQNLSSIYLDIIYNLLILLFIAIFLVMVTNRHINTVNPKDQTEPTI